jgi:hypothetical protein
MPPDQRECPKCGRRMHPGFFLDTPYGTYATTDWIEGPPERSIWLGLKLKGRQRLPVTVYRCERCGFLESYALPR